MRRLRILSITAASLVIPAALWTSLAGLGLLIAADDAILIVTGALFLVMGLVALAGASCALWTRGYEMALSGPTALIIAGSWDLLLVISSGLPNIMTILLGIAALTLVRVASDVFRPLRASHLPHGGMGTHSATAITRARVFSSAGAVMLATVGVGLLFRGYELYTMYQSPDVRFVSGQVFMIAGGVVVASGALAFLRLMLPFTISGAFLALISVVWNIRLVEVLFNDQWAFVAISVSLPAYVFLVLSWPAFGPKEVGQEVPAGAASWDLPDLEGGGLSILKGSSQDVEGWAAVSAVSASVGPSVLGHPREVEGVSVIEAPTEPQAPRPADFIVEEAFVIYGDGRLICACGRDVQGLEDADLMSGMLIAIQGLVQDGLKKGGDLDSITIGDNTVLLTKGEHIILAAVVLGQVSAAFREELRSLVRRIEGAHAGVIEEWDGDASVLSEVTDMVMPLVVGTKHLSRDVVRQASAASEVALRSVTDFHKGYVRVSVVAWNGLPDVIRDVSVEVDYDPRQVRLEVVAPSEVQRRGDRIILGDLRPGEQATAAFLFDPQVPERAAIDGSLTYLDIRGSRRRLEMRRQYADVVCPIFFTPENMNTAALRRLIEERLHSTDLRMFAYPPGLPPQEVLRIGKMALGASGIQLVKEYVVEDHPYQAEVWYYGQTRDEGHPTVARLGVLEDSRLLELYSASTVLEPVVGLQAEFTKELERVYNVRHAGMARMHRSKDQGTRDELERRDLMIDRGI